MLDVMQTALSGLRQAEFRAAQAANNIAEIRLADAGTEAGSASGAVATVVTAPVAGQSPFANDNPFGTGGQDFATAGGHDLATDLVELMIAQHAYEANARVVRTADQMMGTLLSSLA